MTGLGFLDADLMTLEDSLDTDGDGISGKANWITPQSYVELRPNSIPHPNFADRYIGRIGKKAAACERIQSRYGSHICFRTYRYLFRSRN